MVDTGCPEGRYLLETVGVSRRFKVYPRAARSTTILALALSLPVFALSFPKRICVASLPRQRPNPVEYRNPPRTSPPARQRRPNASTRTTSQVRNGHRTNPSQEDFSLFLALAASQISPMRRLSRYLHKEWCNFILMLHSRENRPSHRATIEPAHVDVSHRALAVSHLVSLPQLFLHVLCLYGAFPAVWLETFRHLWSTFTCFYRREGITVAGSAVKVVCKTAFSPCPPELGL